MKKALPAGQLSSSHVCLSGRVVVFVGPVFPQSSIASGFVDAVIQTKRVIMDEIPSTVIESIWHPSFQALVTMSTMCELGYREWGLRV